jgi:hypothetical protein
MKFPIIAVCLLFSLNANLYADPRPSSPTSYSDKESSDEESEGSVEESTSIYQTYRIFCDYVLTPVQSRAFIFNEESSIEIGREFFPETFANGSEVISAIGLIPPELRDITTHINLRGIPPLIYANIIGQIALFFRTQPRFYFTTLQATSD